MTETERRSTAGGMILYSASLSMFGAKVQIALIEKAIDYQLVMVPYDRDRGAHGRARAQELAGQVDVDHRLPIGERHVPDRRGPLDAGIVDQDVKSAKAIERFGDHGVDLVFAGNIGCERDRVPSGISNILDRSIGLGARRSRW